MKIIHFFVYFVLGLMIISCKIINNESKEFEKRLFSETNSEKSEKILMFINNFDKYIDKHYISYNPNKRMYYFVKNLKENCDKDKFDSTIVELKPFIDILIYENILNDLYIQYERKIKLDTSLVNFYESLLEKSEMPHAFLNDSLSFLPPYTFSDELLPQQKYQYNPYNKLNYIVYKTSNPNDTLLKKLVENKINYNLHCVLYRGIISKKNNFNFNSESFKLFIASEAYFNYLYQSQ